MRKSVETVTCDRCGAVDAPGVQRVRLPVGREFDGVETVTDHAEADACPRCLAACLVRVTSSCVMASVSYGPERLAIRFLRDGGK